MPPRVDLVIVLSARVSSINKTQGKENIQEAEEQHTRLLDQLRTNELHAVGKRGEKPGDFLILVGSSLRTLDRLARTERFVPHCWRISLTRFTWG